MSDYSETTTESWLSRLGKSIMGVFVGIILIGVSCYLLYWNEGDTYNRTLTLEKGQAETIEVDAENFNSENNDKVVLFKGLTKTNDVLTDDKFDAISVKDSLKIKRRVEYYQWEERVETHTEKKTGGSTKTKKSYHYDKKWRTSPVSSNSFHVSEGHHNTVLINIPAGEKYAKNVNIGEFILNDVAISNLGNEERITLNKEMNIPMKAGNYTGIKDNYVYFGNSSTDTSIGDVRVSFFVIPCDDATIVAQQKSDKSIQPKQYDTGSLQLNYNGLLTIEEAYKKAHDANSMKAWIIRCVGIFLIYVGFMMIFKPISVLADVLPFLGNIAETGLGFISFILACMLGFTVIAIAWIAVRPILAYTLLAIAAVLAAFAIKKLFSPKKKVQTIVSAPTEAYADL